MARNYAYYVDPEEEERRRLEIEQEPAFGPPAPDLPNLGMMSKGQISAADIEAAQAAAMRPAPVTSTEFAEDEETDQDLAEGLDAMEEEPDGNWAAYSPKEMQRALAYKRAHGQSVDKWAAQAATPLAAPSLIEAELAQQPGPLEAVRPGVLRQDMPLSPTEQAQFKHGLPKTLGNTADENPFGELEELLPPAAPPPAPVDKTAASVSAEQKGVPAEPTPIGTRTAAQIAKIENEQPASARDYGNQAERMSAPAELQKGERTDLLGFDDEEGFSRQKLIERVQQLYGEESAPESRWEDEFTRERGSNRMTDAQIGRRSAVIGFLGGAFEGDSSPGARWADTQHRANQNYEEGRARARDRDQSSRRISRGMAEAIAATGQVSPEAAVQLRMNDKLVKDFGQYASAGGRAEGQGMGLSREKLKVISRLVASGTEEDMKTVRAMLSAATQVDVAEANAGARGQKGVPKTPEEQAAQDAAKAGLLGQALHITNAAAARALTGDFEGMDAKQREQAERMVPQLNQAAAEGRLGQLTVDSLKPQISGEIRNDLSIDKALAVMRANPSNRMDFKNDWDQQKVILNDAYNAWSTLSQDEKVALSDWAAEGFYGQIQKVQLSPEGKRSIAKVRRYVNAIVKRLGGSAVTGSEWARIAEEMGLEKDNWGPFNSPDAIYDHMMQSGQILGAHRKNFETEFGGWEANK